MSLAWFATTIKLLCQLIKEHSPHPRSIDVECQMHNNLTANSSTLIKIKTVMVDDAKEQTAN